MSLTDLDCTAVGEFYTPVGLLMPRMTHRREGRRSAVIERAEAVILRHPEYSVAEIARACAVSESALYEAFRKHSDKSIAQIRRGGIMEAPDIAHYDSVSEIALGQMFGEAAAAFFD